jgi:hypothetical protein
MEPDDAARVKAGLRFPVTTRQPGFRLNLGAGTRLAGIQPHVRDLKNRGIFPQTARLEHFAYNRPYRLRRNGVVAPTCTALCAGCHNHTHALVQVATTMHRPRPGRPAAPAAPPARSHLITKGNPGQPGHKPPGFDRHLRVGGGGWSTGGGPLGRRVVHWRRSTGSAGGPLEAVHWVGGPSACPAIGGSGVGGGE